ncbi:MAG: EF-Tu/IF-2/RF-3 family GTPase [Candidatus Diapherotrites archaeon]
MDSVKCAVFSEQLARELGKTEGQSDLEFYNRVHGGKVLTFIFPRGHPEKINPLLQALYLADYVIISADKIDSALGEIIVAADCLGKEKGFIVQGENLDEGLFEKIIAGTKVQGFEKIQKEAILDRISSMEPIKKEGGTIVDLDAMFNVKGVGVVALGFVAQGKVSKFQKLWALPKNAEVLVKSIQVQDKDIEEAGSGERVGLSLKGIEAEDFSRGMVLSDDNAFEEKKEFNVSFQKNKFCKKEIAEKMQLHVQCRMQIAGCTVKSLNPLRIETGKPIAIRKGESVALCDVEAKPRVIGQGKII